MTYQHRTIICSTYNTQAQFKMAGNAARVNVSRQTEILHLSEQLLTGSQTRI